MKLLSMLLHCNIFMFSKDVLDQLDKLKEIMVTAAKNCLTYSCVSLFWTLLKIDLYLGIYQRKGL